MPKFFLPMLTFFCASNCTSIESTLDVLNNNAEEHILNAHVYKENIPQIASRTIYQISGSFPPTMEPTLSFSRKMKSGSPVQSISGSSPPVQIPSVKSSTIPTLVVSRTSISRPMIASGNVPTVTPSVAILTIIQVIQVKFNLFVKIYSQQTSLFFMKRSFDFIWLLYHEFCFI